MSPLGPARRVLAFVRERVPAHHALYGTAWAVAAESGAALVAGASRPGIHGASRPGATIAWRPGADTAARATALTLTLVAVRMLDDVKDLEHDRVYEPGRPLVRGTVGTGELLGAAAATAAAALGLAATRLGRVSATTLAVTQLYGAALWPLDRALRARRADRPAPLTDAALAYPTQVLGSTFLILSAAETGAAPAGRRAFALVPVFASAFLQFEVARKTRSRPPGRPSDYSSVLPWQACAAAVVGLGEFAVWGLLAASAPWQRAAGARTAAWSPAILSVLPPAAVLGMVRRDRESPRTAVSVALLLALYAAVPAITGKVQRS